MWVHLSPLGYGITREKAMSCPQRVRETEQAFQKPQTSASTVMHGGHEPIIPQHRKMHMAQGTWCRFFWQSPKGQQDCTTWSSKADEVSDLTSSGNLKPHSLERKVAHKVTMQRKFKGKKTHMSFSVSDIWPLMSFGSKHR